MPHALSPFVLRTVPMVVLLVLVLLLLVGTFG